jgi:NAD(P) transhydrogenase subunit alpha
MTLVFIAKESRPGETRVAATPETVLRMVKHGLTVQVATGAGAGARIPDSAYAAAGAAVVAVDSGWAAADLVLKVAAPAPQESRRLQRGAVVVSYLDGPRDPAAARALAVAGATSFAMELVPRITKAQKMDALSSQANIAGYKAVLIAAAALPRYFPMLMTAAGTVRPARVVIFGAGVAGLQAVATAKRLGAIVEATDIRPETKEQVESLGGKFIEVKSDEGAGQPSVYAQEASEDYKRRQREAVGAAVAQADVVITTAQVPGRRAPVLVPEEMVRTMRAGAVIVDLAAEQGGNCPLSEAGSTVEKHGVTIIGPVNLPATTAVHASELYARNVWAVVEHLVPAKGNDARALKLDLAEEICAGAVAIHAGEIRHAPTAQALQTPATA